MKSLKYIIYTLLICLFSNCSGFQAEQEIPYEFDFKEQVFVTGLLTNEAGFVSLDVQNTIPADSTGFNAVNDARVFLYYKEDSNAEAILITDEFTVDNGKYTTEEEIITTEGNIYWAEVILEDGTILKSEEEVLKRSIGLTLTEDEETIRVTIDDPVDEENFYLIYTEFYEDEEVLSYHWYLVDDVNDGSEMFLGINTPGEGITFVMNLYNINYNTFQFYFNTLPQLENEVDIFFSPLKNLYGNLTNVTTNKIALGNFGIAGYSSVAKEF